MTPRVTGWLEVRQLLRGNFSSSGLVRLLGEWMAVEDAPVRQDMAERLSAWLSPVDAIRLQSALQGVQAAPAGPRAAAATWSGTGLADGFARVRDDMAHTIASHELWREPPARPARPLSGAGPSPTEDAPDTAIAYTPYRKLHLEWQRDMETQAAALRAQLRQTLSRVSLPLRQLATLDATLEQMLGEREQKLLATLPALLEKRFAQRRQQHQAQRALTEQPDDPALWRQPGGWLHVFGQDMQEAVLAEWQVRLQPALGLLEAYENELKR